jgi:nicotinamidase-related amidase
MNLLIPGIRIPAPFGLAIFLIALMLSSSCESDEAKEDKPVHENYIKELYIESIPNRGVVNNADNTVKVFFPFNSSEEYQVHFTISEGALAYPESGSWFSPGNSTIKVTAGNGSEREYTLVLEYRSRSALLIIDMQNQNFPVYNQTNLISTVNQLRQKAAANKSFTIYIQHTEFGPWAEGTETWQIFSAVKPAKDDILLQKSTISAMTPEIKDTLHSLGVYKLVMTGTLTNLCIAESIKPAYNSGFQVVIPREGHSTNLDNPEQVIDDFYKEYKRYFDDLTADEIEFGTPKPD